MNSLHGWKLGLAVALALAGALVVAFSVPWKLNFARDWIEARSVASTGRALRIEGDVWWRWGRIGRLSADRLSFANPAWAGRPQMVVAERVELGIALLPLARGQLELHDVRALRPDLWLEKRGERHNWYLDTQQSDGSRAMRIVGALQVDEGRLAYVDAAERTRVEATLQTEAADPRNPGGSARRLSAQAGGTLNGMTLKAQAKGDDLLALRGGENRPYAFELDAAIAATQVAVSGSIRTPTDFRAADLKLAVSGPSLGDWYRIAKVGLPETPAYRTQGRLRYDGKAWTYEDFTGLVGRSDLAGRIVFEPRASRPGQQRPRVSGTLVSRSLDLRDFGPAVGKPAASKAAAADGTRRVLPQQRFDTERWDSLDADLKFAGASVRNFGSFPLDDLAFQLKLDDRRLQLDPLSLKAGGGTFSGRMKIDGAAQPMRAELDAQWRGLQLDALLPQLSTTRSALGTLNGKARLSGQGNSFAQMLGTAHGEAQIAMGRGRVSNLLVELMDLDAFEALAFLVRGDKDITVRCAVVDAAFERGTMTPRTAVFDTTDTYVHATGHVDFAQERLALRVTPLPKDLSPLSARVPFDVTGSFAQPSVAPDKTRLAVRGGGALLLGLINPLAALIPLIETGPGKDADCAGLTALARKDGVPVKSEAGAAPDEAQNRK